MMVSPGWFAPPKRQFSLAPPAAVELVEDFVIRCDDVEQRIAERREARWELQDQTRTQIGTLLRFVGREAINICPHAR